MKKTVNGIIFDMDGLMFDTEKIYGIYWREVSAELGFPMDEAMVAQMCGDEVSACKPDPEIFLKAAALIGVPPIECIVLEDSYNGIRAAHAAGAQPIMIPDTMQPTEEIRALCTHVLPRLDNVINVL